MKTPLRYILGIVVLFCASSLNAQEFFVGPKAGLQYYTIRFAEEETRASLDNKGKIGYKAGWTIIFPLADDFFFGTELYYSKKGRKYEYGDGSMNNASYNFLELSGYLRKSFPIRFAENKYPGKWFFNVGPNIMHWMNGKGSIENVATLDYEVVFSEPEDADFRKNYISDANQWLFGLDFGAGISFLTRNNENLFIEMRYTHGHTFLGGANSESHLSILGFEDDLKAQYRIFHLSVAYLFDVNLRNLRKGKSTIKRK